VTRHLKYARYLALHKWYVLLAGLKVGVPLRRLVVHDWSKLLPSEWIPYARYFYAEKTPAAELGFNHAWLHHQNRNDHHWQWWLITYDRGETEALEMSEPAAREMVADWAGAGRAITGRWEAGAWYLANRAKIILHPRTRARVERLLHLVQPGYDGPGVAP
jgi:hypothetical protein